MAGFTLFEKPWENGGKYLFPNKEKQKDNV